MMLGSLDGTGAEMYNGAVAGIVMGVLGIPVELHVCKRDEG